MGRGIAGEGYADDGEVELAQDGEPLPEVDVVGLDEDVFVSGDGRFGPAGGFGSLAFGVVSADWVKKEPGALDVCPSQPIYVLWEDGFVPDSLALGHLIGEENGLFSRE